MNNISIGIIGGMGPQASALLHTLIVQAATSQMGVQQASDFPLITHVSIPAIDFISNPELRHQNRGLLGRAVRTLQTNRPDAVVVACNTAHLLVDELPELSSLPLISLPEVTVAEAQRQGLTNVGLLASPTTIQTGLYHHIADRHKVTLITLDQHDQDITESIIRNVIAGQSNKREHARLEKLISKLLANGAEKVILGCTELSVLGHDLSTKQTINPLQVTVDTVVDIARKRSIAS